MHNNIMAAGSRDRPPMLATGRYAQWRSRFLRYIDTRPNGDALRKCILKGPYTPTIVTTPAVPATEDSPSADTTVPSQQELDLLFGPLYDEFFIDSTSRVNKSSSPTDNSAPQDTHPSTNIHPTSKPSTPTNVHVEENNDNQAKFTNPFCTSVQENAESSSRNIASANKTTMFALTVSIVEPKNIKEAMADSAWIEAMQEELHQFDKLHVWELC
ncbi:hypothetical protein Tco_0827101 [Tanacetum coccineum]